MDFQNEIYSSTFTSHMIYDHLPDTEDGSIKLQNKLSNLVKPGRVHCRIALFEPESRVSTQQALNPKLYPTNICNIKN